MLPAACLERLVRADLIIHAGDVADTDTLRMLRSFGIPLIAVKGNVDPADLDLPAAAGIDVDGTTVAVVHNGGAEAGRLARMRTRFPDAGLVIFGHSHIPLLERADDGFTILNPGSPTDRRKQPRHTMAEVLIEAGRPPVVAFFAVDDPAGPLDPELVRGGAR